MNYPLISEYIEAIKSAEDNFEELSYLRPVLGDDGLPVMTSGNFAVVFKMKDEQSEKFYAVKCFTKEQDGRTEAYREITKELKDVSSPYLTSVRYLDKELFVDTDQTSETEFPVLLMDWVEGKTLDKYLRENLDDKYALEMLAYRFSQLAQWLIPQPFAHGDLKPDNIIVREDGTIALVDYDGMYVPSMKGQKARELGSPSFRHPQRTKNDFNEHIDDFSLISILLSLKAISINPLLLDEYGTADRLLLSERDYLNISTSKILKELYPSSDSELNVLLGFFIIFFERKGLFHMPYQIFKLCRPIPEEEVAAYIEAWEDDSYYKIVNRWPFEEFANHFDEIIAGCSYYSVKEDVENALFFINNNGKELIVYNFDCLSLEQINKYKHILKIHLTISGHYVLSRIPREYLIDEDNAEVSNNLFVNCWIDEYGVRYSADKKYLLEGPIEEAIKGSHIWKKALLSDSYTIEQGTMFIRERAFFDCRGLISITFPSSIIEIGSQAFSGCSNLAYVHMNDRIQRIGDEAFKNCKNLHSISVPQSLTYIGDNAFEGSGINAIFTNFGDNKRVESLLPKYKDMIIIEPAF